MAATIEALQQKTEAAARALDSEEAKRSCDKIEPIHGGATAMEVEQADTSDSRSAPGIVTIRDAREMTLALLAARSHHATVCPSEVARAITSNVTPNEAGGWREAMPIVHAAVDRLLADGRVRLSWKGEPLTPRAGPYRIGRGTPG